MLSSIVSAQVLKLDNDMKALAEQLKGEESLLVFARGYNYATALEAALKVSSYTSAYRLQQGCMLRGRWPVRDVPSGRAFWLLVCDAVLVSIVNAHHICLKILAHVGCALAPGEGGGLHAQRGHPGGRDEARTLGAGG